jgi:hypothetical protein
MPQISQLPAGTVLTGTEAVPLVQQNITVEVPSQFFWNLPVYTYAQLIALTPVAGARANCSNSNTGTFLATVSGTGINFVPVFYNGTNWIVG